MKIDKITHKSDVKKNLQTKKNEKHLKTFTKRRHQLNKKDKIC